MNRQLCDICKEHLEAAIIRDASHEWHLCNDCLNRFCFWRWLIAQGTVGGREDGAGEYVGKWVAA